MFLDDIFQSWARILRRPVMRIFMFVYIAVLFGWLGYILIRDRTQRQLAQYRVSTLSSRALADDLQAKFDAIDRRLKAVEARSSPTADEIASLRTELRSLDPTKLQSLIATAETYGGVSKRLNTHSFQAVLAAISGG